MAEFVIIGGGVYGAGLAYHLVKRGASVHLVEKKQIGNGASAGPGRRGVRANGRDLRELPLVRQARDIWPTLHEMLDVPQFFEELDHLMLIERDQDLAVAAARAQLQTQYGIETHLLSREEVHTLESGLSENVIGALHCPTDGASDHTAVTNAYAAAAKRLGARISEQTRIARIEHEASRATAIITTDGERIAIERSLTILANAGVADLLRDRLKLPMWSRTFQVLLTNPQPRPLPGHLIGHASRTLALKREDGDRIMISGGLPGSWDPETERGTATHPSIEANFADAIAVYPELKSAEIEVADADHLETSTIDGIPAIDRVPGWENAIYAAGWCGHGWAIAPAIVELLAEWSLTGNRPAVLAPFTHARFGLS